MISLFRYVVIDSSNNWRVENNHLYLNGLQNDFHLGEFYANNFRKDFPNYWHVSIKELK